MPFLARLPGKVKPGSVSNEIMSHLDWAPTLLAAAGAPEVEKELLKGYKADGKKFKIHLDGYDFGPYLTGKEKKGPREEYFYFSYGGKMLGVRYYNWKVVFSEQDVVGTFKVWANPFVTWRVPYIYNLRTDPYERSTITSNSYMNWWIEHTWMLVPVQQKVAAFIGTFKEYPPRAKAASFTVDQVMETLQKGHGG